jgi:hypothetical protein
MEKAGLLYPAFLCPSSSCVRATCFRPCPTVVQGPKEEGKAPSRQTAKEGGGWMPAGFGRAGARFFSSERKIEAQVEKESDTETGVSILHII